jgi:hypothetical protein
MSTDYTPEVFTLANRVAAAFMREDPEYARELINNERLRWEAAGRDQHRRDVEKCRDAEMEFERTANVYFETKDGLRVLGEIEPRGHWPRIWKRACRVKRTGLIEDTPGFEPIEVRTYERSADRAKDGRPVYIEA